MPILYYTVGLHCNMVYSWAN